MKTLPNAITRWDELKVLTSTVQIYDRYNSFIQFIKRPLKPWMFIPWDMGKNCPLEEPDKDNMAFYTHKNISIQEEYQQAKDRVLFDGFELVKTYDNRYLIGNTKDNYYLTIYIGGHKSIQDLVDKVSLTETGQKQSGLI